jgi:hypothetical protein
MLFANCCEDDIVVHVIPFVQANIKNADWEFRDAAVMAFGCIIEEPDPKTKKPLAEEHETYALSAYFRPIVDKLVATTDRADGNQANLRPAAYEALNELIKNSPRDCYETVQHTTVIILERLKTVLIMENQNNAGDRTQFNELQSSLCATLQSVLRKGEYKYKNC